MAQHLIHVGHRRIGLIGGGQNVRATRVRADTLVAVCAEHRGVKPYVNYGSYSAGHGEAATEALLAKRDPPTAIVAGGNQILVGVLRTLRRRKLVIPRDISLVTCDRVPLSEFLQPPIATIERDTRQIGQAAAQLLLEQLQSTQTRQIVLPVKFVPDESCGPPSSRSQ